MYARIHLYTKLKKKKKKMCIVRHALEDTTPDARLLLYHRQGFRSIWHREFAGSVVQLDKLSDSKEL